MRLEDFVSESLQEILRGVSKAQQFAAAHGGQVVPEGLSYQTAAAGQLWDADLNVVGTIEFDVAVTVSEGATAKGGIGVFVGPVGVGTQGQLDSANGSVSRIKFSIPLGLPVQSKGDE